MYMCFIEEIYPNFNSVSESSLYKYIKGKYTRAFVNRDNSIRVFLHTSIKLIE